MAKTKPSVIVLKVGSAMTSTWPLIILLNLNFLVNLKGFMSYELVLFLKPSFMFQKKIKKACYCNSKQAQSRVPSIGMDRRLTPDRALG